MKKNFSFLFFAACLFLASCKKETIYTPGNGGNVSKKLVQTNLNGTIKVSYNADGTPKQIIHTTVNGDYIKTFSYSPGKVNYILTRNNKKEETGECVLVNGKMSTYDWITYDYFEQPGTYYSESFEYNAKGLLSRRNFGANYAEYQYDANDNLVVMTYFNSQGGALSKTEFTYTNQKDLSPQFGWLTYDGIGCFLPGYSKHLFASRKSTDLVTAQITYEANYSYDLDKDGYAIKGKCDALLAGYNDYEWVNSYQ